MSRQIWLNLPVKNVTKSKDFFTKLGFSFNDQRTTEQSACMLMGGNNFVVMLFEASLFESFTQNKITDTKQSSEVLISIDAKDKEEVDALANKVIEAGGSLFAPPAENQGWMYGCGFCDLDGHRWNILHMDYNKIPL